MKELSIEEKAKRYDEALERAKVVNKGTEDYNIVTTIFPELKESEDDEQIRKAIVNHLLELSKSRVNLMTKATYENWITWLKKQGEKKPADKVEPKFNVGDWLVCCNYEPEQIIGIRNDMYEMSNGDIRPIKMINKNHNIRLWTIQDAKDGDVLATKNFIFIFKNIDSDNGVRYYCHYEISDHEEDNLFEVAFPLCWMGRVGNGISYYSPATKEQRDLLFSKMKEAGYEWDAEDKVLRKIGQKPAWSKADDEILHEISQCIYDNIINIGTVNKGRYIDWLKSLKERMKGE